MTIKLSASVWGISASILLMGCGATSLVSTPIANIDTTPLKISELSDAQKKNWGHLDLVTDTIPGMSIEKAIKKLLK